MKINTEQFELLKRESLLFTSNYHGLHHWRTVEKNGLYLTQFVNADPAVVTYFSYLHDCKREDEHKDPNHGPRAVEFAKEHRELIELSDEQFELLCVACYGHTFGDPPENITVATCWDADRLDIGRVGIIPDAQYLFTSEAKRIADEKDFVVLEMSYSD